MKTLIFQLFLALLPLWVRAHTTPLVEGRVNPITGAYVASHTDHSVKGAEPIPIIRTYHPKTQTWSFEETAPTAYDAQNRIQRIENNYAWAQFTYPDETTLIITTSDAQEIIYTNYPSITHITRNGYPIETLSYAPRTHTLQKRTYSPTKEEHIEVYRPRWNSVGTDYIILTDPNDFRLGRVKTLKSTRTLRFYYNQNSTDVVDADNNKTTFTYDQDQNLLSIQIYDANGTLQETIDPNQPPPPPPQNDTSDLHITPRTTPPFLGLPDTIEKDHIKTVLTYDKYGNIIAKQIFDATNTPRYTLHYTYDLLGRLLTETNPLGQTATYTYDTSGNLFQKTSFSGQLTTEYIYDTSGTLTHLKQIAQDGTTHTHPYTPLTLPPPKTTPIPNATYDPLGRLSCIRTETTQTHKTYDLLDRLTEEIVTDPLGHLLSKISYAYDAAGNRSQITRWIDRKPATTTYRYDPFGRLTEEISPEGDITHIDYDESHPPNLTTIRTSPLGIQTHDTYDAHHRRIHTLIKDTQGNTVSFETFTYDPSGNLIEHTCPHKTLWEYDTQGNLITLTEGEHTTHYTYDRLGHLQETIKPDGTHLFYTYTQDGLLSALSSSDNTIDYTYTYDTNHNLLTARDNLTNQTLTRTYDPSGNLLQETLPTGLTLTHTYDTQNRRTQLTLPDQSTIHYTYGPLHLEEVTRFAPQKHLLYTHTYTTYDLSGNPLEEEHIANLGTTTRTYDPSGHVIHLTSPHLTQSATYDPDHNLISTQLKTPISGYSANYTYDPLNQLTQETAPTFQTHTYDAHHNHLTPSTPQKHQLIFDALDRLTHVITDSATITYTYDALHRRITKTTPTEVEHYLYDHSHEIGSTDANHHIKELRVLGNTPHAEIGATVAIEIDSRPYCPIHDIFGNITHLIDPETRQIASLTHYTAFGVEKHLFTPHVNTPWRYASKRTDPETGLVYFGRRYYNPQAGQWLTPDPKGFTGTTNLYTYNHNAPLTHHDPFGLETHPLYTALGNTIYFLYENFALFPYIREKGMSFGNYLRGKNTPIQKEQTSLDSVGTGNINPNIKTYYTNGILNDHINAKESALAISSSLANTTVSFAHHPSSGLLRDFVECGTSLLGFQTPASILLKENIRKDIQENPNITIILIDHSLGNINANNALNNLTPEELSHIERHSFASPSYHPIPHLKSDHHYIVRNDLIPWINPFASAKAYLYDNPNIHILDTCCNNPLTSHELLGPAYHPQIKQLGVDYLQRYTNPP